jgi:hypothetical protein
VCPAEAASWSVARRPAVALATEEDLGRVDLNESDALAVAEGDCVAIAQMVDAVDGRSGDRARCGERER